MMKLLRGKWFLLNAVLALGAGLLVGFAQQPRGKAVIAEVTGIGPRPPGLGAVRLTDSEYDEQRAKLRAAFPEGVPETLRLMDLTDSYKVAECRANLRTEREGRACSLNKSDAQTGFKSILLQESHPGIEDVFEPLRFFRGKDFAGDGRVVFFLDRDGRPKMLFDLHGGFHMKQVWVRTAEQAVGTGTLLERMDELNGVYMGDDPASGPAGHAPLFFDGLRLDRPQPIQLGRIEPDTQSARRFRFYAVLTGKAFAEPAIRLTASGQRGASRQEMASDVWRPGVRDTIRFMLNKSPVPTTVVSQKQCTTTRADVFAVQVDQDKMIFYRAMNYAGTKRLRFALASNGIEQPLESVKPLGGTYLLRVPPAWRFSAGDELRVYRDPGDARATTAWDACGRVGDLFGGDSLLPDNTRASR